MAARHTGGRVVSVLEGGYDLNALAASAAVHVRTLMQA
jgi:acetoin utilization deacetylase AcuC-like enzyme